MAQNYRINMKRWNGTDYDTLLPMNGGSNPVIGDIMLTTGNPPDDTWALCNGDEIDPAEYPVLAGIIQENLDVPVAKTLTTTTTKKKIKSHGNQVVTFGSGSSSYGMTDVGISTNGGTTFTNKKINDLDVYWFHVNYLNGKWMFFGTSGSKMSVATSTDLTNFAVYSNVLTLKRATNIIVDSASSVYFKGKYFVLFRDSATSGGYDYCYLGYSSDGTSWSEKIDTFSGKKPNDSTTNLSVTPDGTCMGFFGRDQYGDVSSENADYYYATTDGNNFSITNIPNTIIYWENHFNNLLLFNGSNATKANCLVGAYHSDDYYTYYLNQNNRIASNGKAFIFSDYKYVDDNIVYTLGNPICKYILHDSGFNRIESDMSTFGNASVTFSIGDKIYGHYLTGTTAPVFTIPKTLPMIANSNYFAYIKTNF